MPHKDHRLAITCFGRAEHLEDDPQLGTFWIAESRNLGQGYGIQDAVALAERCASRQEFDSVSFPDARRFAPQRVLVRDSSERLVLGGKVVGETIDWCTPVTSDDEAARLRREIDDLLGEAALEAGWDNYSTARGLRARAALLEARIVDPAWRADAMSVLRSQPQSKR